MHLKQFLNIMIYFSLILTHVRVSTFKDLQHCGILYEYTKVQYEHRRETAFFVMMCLTPCNYISQQS